jgi:hypothetical protein
VRLVRVRIVFARLMMAYGNPAGATSEPGHKSPIRPSSQSLTYPR